MSLPSSSGSHRVRSIPDSAAARRDDIDRALRSLCDERRRLERLGFELPLARCDHETRYWRFLSAMFTGSSRARSSASSGDRPWPDAPVR